MVGWRRARVVGGLALSGVLLTGCHVEGTAELRADDRVSLDLVVLGDDLVCGAKGNLPTLTFTPDPRGGCHVTGVTMLNQFPDAQSSFLDVAEYRVLETTFTGDHSSWPDGGVTLKLPGLVLSSNQGTVAENTVRLEDLPALDNHLKVVMLSRPGPPNSVVWLAAGFVGGVTLAFLVVGLARVLRRRRSVPAEPVAGGTEPQPPREEARAAVSALEPKPEPASPPEPEPPSDNSVWAPSWEPPGLGAGDPGVRRDDRGGRSPG